LKENSKRDVGRWQRKRDGRPQRDVHGEIEGVGRRRRESWSPEEIKSPEESDGRREKENMNRQAYRKEREKET
jgi:hypothetical protein